MHSFFIQNVAVDLTAFLVSKLGHKIATYYVIKAFLLSRLFQIAEEHVEDH